MRAAQARRPFGLPALFVVSLAAVGWLVACATRSPGARAYPEFVRFAGREIEDVDFTDGAPFPQDTLDALVRTEASRCSLLGLPICPFGLGEREEFLDLDVLRADAVRLALFFRQSGFFGTEVEPEVEEATNGDVVVTFVIQRGDSVVVRSLDIEGVAGVLDTARLRRRLPLRPGERLDLRELAASGDTILAELRSRGYAYAQVLREFTADTVADVADAALTALPGPQVVIDSIAVIGANNLGRAAVLRQLEFREGDLLRLNELAASQRNLYALDIVQFASVAIAAEDTAGAAPPPDGAGATVVVRIVEAPVHVVDASVGFGTVDCLRAGVQWTSRSLGGGARRLALTASVSKLGIGAPLDLSAGRAVCREFRNEPFPSRVDYRVAAEFTEPGFLGARNQLTLAAFGERESEPRIFQREAYGGRIALARRLGLREAGTLSLGFERGRTLATPVIFCTALLVCRPEDIAEVQRFRWRNTLGAAWAQDRTDQVLDPRRGYRAGSSLTWAANWLGSGTRFVRGTGDFSRYWPFGPDRVVAAAIRLGTFFGTASLEPDDDFLPPEDRFFAGGATTVRGFSRNGLGPRVYVTTEVRVDALTGDTLIAEEDVTFVPIGGTALAIVNFELRVPAPFARDRVRLAWFVDAGALEDGDLGDLRPENWRVTPGVGARIRSAVGPIRIDLGFNPYDARRGPLFLARADTLVQIAPDFAPELTLLDRFRLHLALGQAF